MCTLMWMCALVSADGASNPSVDAVAVQQHMLLRQVALCCLLDAVDLPFLDGIANHSGMEQVGWLSNSSGNGLKLTYENPLFASLRLLFIHIIT